MSDVGDKEIKDIKLYTDEMAKAMKDKLFFTDYLYNSIWNFVDFGCANGKLLEALSMMDNFKHSTFTGYDASKEMIAMARSQWQNQDKSIKFTSDWNSIKFGEKSVLILSSVLHEVYSYYKQGAINDFWSQILRSNASYIVIRDMCTSSDMDRILYDESVDYGWGENPKEHIIDNFIRTSGVKDWQIEQFEERWGSISNVKNFLHLLLKYRYIVNWERELNENYFSVSDSELLKRIERSNYNIVYLKRFQLPTIYQYTNPKYIWKYNIHDNTHIKMILKKKGSY